MPKKLSLELECLEQFLKATKEHDGFAKVAKEYNRLLDVLGNVDGDEVLALAVMTLCVTHKEVFARNVSCDDPMWIAYNKLRICYLGASHKDK